ncbi:hypothetical protein NEQG_00653 [Nematocida parisii ERTm3]|uniref:Uncharacterized protein n=1 Tax=Nematocida parisii (strain ERTm3) TaxID=935791 RepID=I3EHY7_NEMP3|nr:hypothetical protein NEQG_00653 [Nematocida parisii ERTm3]
MKGFIYIFTILIILNLISVKARRCVPQAGCGKARNYRTNDCDSTNDYNRTGDCNRTGKCCGGRCC